MSAGYDVKGSTHNRQASDRELAKNTYAVLKDFDLVTRGRFLCVRTRSEKERLMSLLTADVAWLQRHGLMDYSCLIGYMARGVEEEAVISSPRETSDENTGATNPLMKQNSGLTSGGRKSFGKDNRFAIHLLSVTDPDFSAAHVGIVDILTRYGLKKRAEHFCLGVVANRPGASCQPPNVYGNRFVRFMDMIIIALDEKHANDAPVGSVDDGEAGLREERARRANMWFAAHGRVGLVVHRSLWKRVLGSCCGCCTSGGKKVVVNPGLNGIGALSNGYESITL